MQKRIIFIFFCLTFFISSCFLDQGEIQDKFPDISVIFPQNGGEVSTNFVVYGDISSLDDVEGVYLILNSTVEKANSYSFYGKNFWEKNVSLNSGEVNISYYIKMKSGKCSKTNSLRITVSDSLPFLKVIFPTNCQVFSTNEIISSGEIVSEAKCNLKIILNNSNTNELNKKGGFSTNLLIEKGLNILSYELYYNNKIVSKNRVIFKGPAIDPATMIKKLGKGVNMGNALEAYPNEDSWGNPIKDEYFTLMKQAGFDTVRIPIRWSTRAQDTSPYTINSDFFNRVDHVVNVALNAGLNVIINIHHFDELISDPTGKREKFFALWRQISEHYKDAPDNLLFEVLNEPNGNVEPYWTDLMTNAIKIIREKNPTRIIIIGGINWNSIDGLTNLYIPSGDNYLIATFHFYEPFVFTHQGAEWGGSISNVSNIVWPGPPQTPVPIPSNVDQWIKDWLNDYNTKTGDANPASSNQIVQRLNTVANWSSQKKIPVWLGEFGVYGKYADINSRVRWTHFVRTECEKRNISWCYWEFSSGFGIYNPSTGQWNTELSNALLGN